MGSKTGRRADKLDAFIGQRIRAARITAGMSQTELAEKIGVTFQQVQKYEKGVNRVGGGRMVRISEALHRPIAWFSDGATSNPNQVTDDPLTKLGQTRGGVELAKAYLSINDAAKRAVLVGTARAMAA